MAVRKEAEIAWMPEGNCRRVPAEMMFPSDGAGVAVAQRVCADCPVRQQCLDYALANHIEHGVWGGTSDRKRRRITRQWRAATHDSEAHKWSPHTTVTSTSTPTTATPSSGEPARDPRPTTAAN